MSNLSSFQNKAQGVKIERPKTDPIKKPLSRKIAVKDTFSFPEDDHALIENLIKSLLSKGVHASKSEIVRAGLHALNDMEIDESIEVISKLERLQTGRPKSR